MSTADSKHSKLTPEAPCDLGIDATAEGGLTQQAFDKLLSSFSPDRDEAGDTYEIIRRKLVRFFEGRAIDFAEERADETINRVARRIDEGQAIQNLRNYFYGVARLVLMEALKEKERTDLELNEAVHAVSETLPLEIEPEARLKCFDRCLELLAPESRQLIIEYYQEERRAKIELRQQIATRLCIPLNALRIRAHRIRASLESCITRCLQQPAKAK